ncbi:transmembrane and ubiquitin-like [Homalodisca vitripennis]|nr:transmembrane and ubiquitin-like [Homalodisca vitripennis]
MAKFWEVISRPCRRVDCMITVLFIVWCTARDPVQPPDWNLSTLLYTCLSLVLCLVWYCRYQYAQLFTLTTTAALIGLTGIFTVSVFSLYLPDQDGIPH